MMDKEGFSGKYDFLYLPIDAWLRADSVSALKVLVCFSSKDFRSKASLGYAFVNLISAREAAMANTNVSCFSNLVHLSLVVLVVLAVRHGNFGRLLMATRSGCYQAPRPGHEGSHS